MFTSVHIDANTKESARATDASRTRKSRRLKEKTQQRVLNGLRKEMTLDEVMTKTRDGTKWKKSKQVATRRH